MISAALLALALAVSGPEAAPASELASSEQLAPVPEERPLEAPSEEVTSKWWFWTTLVVAVAAGSATAIALASGSKGGPSLESPEGRIQGSY